MDDPLEVVKRIYANGSTVREKKFDRWLAEHDAKVLRDAADELGRGSKSSSEYWDGERVSYIGYETSPDDRTPHAWLRDRADRITA